MDPQDELMHPVKDGAAWSESYYFNFVDPESKLAMFTRMGFRPRDGWADGLHVIYLGGDRVAFTYGRRDIGQDLTAYNGDLAAGNLLLECQKPFELWTIRYDGPAQDVANARVLLERSKSRPDGWFQPVHLQMAVDFKGLYPPHYAADGERGHFEQTGEVTGEIRLNEKVYTVRGLGVRDKSWGPRDWGAGGGSGDGGGKPSAAMPSPFVNWFSVNFSPDLAMGGSCGRDRDGTMRGKGWLQEAGVNTDLEDIVITSRYADDSILHRDVTLTARKASGKSLVVEGRILTVCPTKIPMPGGVVFVNEGLAEFTCEGQTGYGISEHWHLVKLS